MGIVLTMDTRASAVGLIFCFHVCVLLGGVGSASVGGDVFDYTLRSQLHDPSHWFSCKLVQILRAPT